MGAKSVLTNYSGEKYRLCGWSNFNVCTWYVRLGFVYCMQSAALHFKPNFKDYQV